MGLAHLGLDDKTKAICDFKKVLDIDASHQNAILYLRMAEA